MAAGPVFDHFIEAGIIAVAAGPVFDHFIEAGIVVAAGPVFDHDAEAFPGIAAGPIFDHFTAIPPPPSFSGPTGGRFPATAGSTFGRPTGGRVSSILPARGFGALTGGSFVGLPTPINLTATVIDAGCVRLDWIDAGPEEDGYRVERSPAGMGDWTIIGTLDADVTTYLDRFAVPLVVYDYHVISFDAIKTSSPSNIATAVTPLPSDISTGAPPTSPVDPPRNRIEPDVLEFKSPGVYGLEKDNEGNITGFKF